MSEQVEIVDIDASNIAKHGFFCFKSKPKSVGHRRKRDWLEQRFVEGMKLKLIYEQGKQAGFIEYIPGEFTWRAIEAPDYVVIHCVWVVGRWKGKGYASRLLDECVQDAQRLNKHGVAMVTRSGGYLAGKKLFLRNGFEQVDQAPPEFELMVKRFGDAPPPAFPRDWEQRAARYGRGLTIIRSDQCPYYDGAVNETLQVAGEMGLSAQVVELTDCKQAQDLSPSAYGVFGLVYDGQLLSFRPLEKKELVKRLDELGL